MESPPILGALSNSRDGILYLKILHLLIKFITKNIRISCLFSGLVAVIIHRNQRDFFVSFIAKRRHYAVQVQGPHDAPLVLFHAINHTPAVALELLNVPPTCGAVACTTRSEQYPAVRGFRGCRHRPLRGTPSLPLPLRAGSHHRHRRAPCGSLSKRLRRFPRLRDDWARLLKRRPEHEER